MRVYRINIINKSIHYKKDTVNIFILVIYLLLKHLQ